MTHMLEIPALPASTILLVEVGSTAHGTGLSGGEDNDEMGVLIESPDDVIGLGERGFATVMQRTQPEGTRSGPGDTDRTLHSLRRFLRLAASGKPTRVTQPGWYSSTLTTSSSERALSLSWIRQPSVSSSQLAEAPISSSNCRARSRSRARSWFSAKTTYATDPSLRRCVGAAHAPPTPGKIIVSHEG